MPKKRLSMRKIRELPRLKYELRRSHREIAMSLGIANSTVSDYARRAAAAGLTSGRTIRFDDLYPGTVCRTLMTSASRALRPDTPKPPRGSPYQGKAFSP